MAEEKEGGAFNDKLLSRQLYVMGHAAQSRIASSSVLIVGLNGLGVETAKDVILAGVKSVTLLDDTPSSWSDLSSQFYLTEGDMGRPRAAASLPKLAELSPYCTVSLITGELTTATVVGYTVVVLIDVPLSKQLEIAEYCHSQKITVVIGDVRGVFGNIFCDFAPSKIENQSGSSSTKYASGFVVQDTNGEPNASSMIAAVHQRNPGLITVLEDTRHNLSTGDRVVLSEVKGMPELEGREFNVTVKDPYSFEIDADTSSLGAHGGGGYVNQVKVPEVHTFESLSASIRRPGMFVGDVVKMDRHAPLHLGFQALQQFRDAQGSLPEPGNVAHAQMVYDLAVALNSSAAEGDLKLDATDMSASEALIKRLAMCSRGLVGPVCALMGGILGQEVLKACSGKFMPIKQWFYYDALEALPDNPLLQEEVTPMGCRYDGQIMVFGRQIQEKLSRLKVFIVGAGAIGCEMIKNYAMMGIACDPAGIGRVFVTDMDQIELSNLSRQFLFRNTDINQPKSTTAARAVTQMNPEFRTTAYEQKVAPDTETLFNDDFFDELDAVATALDNVEARLYIDQRCVFYRKPMLESGTLGTKGHTQVVVPSKTENYGATRDPPEKGIPICTLKHFPNLIEHTLAWSREWFEEEFKQAPDDVNSYLTSTDFSSLLASQQNMKLTTLGRIKDSLVEKRPSSIEDCIQWARLTFEDLFSNKIKQLLHVFPLDKMIVSSSSAATPFWSGAKKPPRPLSFDFSDPEHAEFIKAVANMRAEVYGIPTTQERGLGDAEEAALVESVLRSLHVPAFRPSDGVTIPSTDEEAKNASQNGAAAALPDIDAQCNQVLSQLPAPGSLTGFSMRAIDFDKDIDSQMAVIKSCANLRARNYQIHEVDLHTARGIAGKIMPAISTTTALVTGAICVELYKILQDKPVEKLCNSTINLALPFFVGNEPPPPTPTVTTLKGQEWKFTLWDRVDISQPTMTLSELIQKLKDDYGLGLTMLSAGVTILYSDFMDQRKARERMGMKLTEVVEMITKKTIPPTQRLMIFELICSDEESGDEVEMPPLRFRLR